MENKLYNNPQDCCACGACCSICKHNAITIQKDSFGFYYPVIDEEKCVQCNQCKEVCSFTKAGQNVQTECLAVYAAASKDDEVLERSSSGGIFAELAKEILRQGGIVFGAAWNDDLEVSHIGISSIAELCKLQGSKYTQSYVGDSYILAKKSLDSGKKVLYSGTPCQISGLRSYLKRDYSNLYTVDLICHGVGSGTFLKEDIKKLANGRKVENATFRTKRKGWGTIGEIVLDQDRKIPFDAQTSPYYYYFLNCSIFRDSCYHCRFPSENRTGDLTIGDYWRIESAHPESRTMFNYKKGVSCVLVNNAQGEKLFNQIKSELVVLKSDIEKIEQRNGQLVHSCRESDLRSKLFEIYLNNGYDGIVDYWKTREKKAIFLLKMKKVIPSKLKSRLKKYFKN